MNCYLQPMPSRSTFHAVIWAASHIAARGASRALSRSGGRLEVGGPTPPRRCDDAGPPLHSLGALGRDWVPAPCGDGSSRLPLHLSVPALPACPATAAAPHAPARDMHPPPLRGESHAARCFVLRYEAGNVACNAARLRAISNFVRCSNACSNVQPFW